MALDNFTLMTNPVTGAALTDANTVFVSGYVDGNDLNIGARTSPVATLARAMNLLTAQKFHVLIRGKVGGTVSIPVNGTCFIGEQDAYIDDTVTAATPFDGTNKAYFINIDINSITYSISGSRSVITYLYSSRVRHILRAHYLYIVRSEVNTIYASFYGDRLGLLFRNTTIKKINKQNGTNSYIDDSIIFDVELNSSSGYMTFSHCLFTKQHSRFFWNGNLIDTSQANDISGIVTALKAHATANNLPFLSSMADMLFDDCELYDDAPTANVRVFNAYDSNGINPIDLHPNFQNGNPALYRSSENSVVGAFRPKKNLFLDVNDPNKLRNLDENWTHLQGTDATLLHYNNGYYLDIHSPDVVNQIESDVMMISQGDRITRFAADFVPGINSGYYTGLRQSGDFRLDSIEIKPYDSISQPSAFPIVSLPINRDVRICYYKTGPKTGQPVLFNDLAGLGIATNKDIPVIGATHCVTNAHTEYDDLMQLPEIEDRLPLIMYFKVILTVNRDV